MARRSLKDAFTRLLSKPLERGSYVENHGEAYRRVQADKPLMLPNPLLLFKTDPNYHERQE